jgi:hypothetical protein
VAIGKPLADLEGSERSTASEPGVSRVVIYSMENFHRRFAAIQNQGLFEPIVPDVE